VCGESFVTATANVQLKLDECEPLVTDGHARAKRLSLLVSERMGGYRPDTIVEAVEGELTRLMSLGGGTRIVHIGEMKFG